jgi:nucleoside-diphosphate-sugar epimerase
LLEHAIDISTRSRLQAISRDPSGEPGKLSLTVIKTEQADPSKDTSAASLRPALEGAGAVVHLAQIGAERPGVTFEAINIEGTRQLLRACEDVGVPRIVLLSGLGVARYGLARRLTNRYFLSKLAAEVEAFRSGRQTVVFRPSYIVGRGDTFVSSMLEPIRRGEVEIVGDGLYRLQPVAVADAAEAILTALTLAPSPPRVFDLVGPEPVSYRDLVLRLAGRLSAPVRLAAVSVEEAERAAAAGGFQGLSLEELDVLLSDEVSDSRPLEGLLGRFLAPLDQALASALPARDARHGRG